MLNSICIHCLFKPSQSYKRFLWGFFPHSHSSNIDLLEICMIKIKRRQQYISWQLQNNQYMHLLWSFCNGGWGCIYLRLHLLCNGYHGCLEYGRSWVWAPVGSNQRLWYWDLLLLRYACSIKEQWLVGSESGYCVWMEWHLYPRTVV
jgi:hypothetical protein